MVFRILRAKQTCQRTVTSLNYEHEPREIISEIPKLLHANRREMMRCIIEAEEDEDEKNATW